VVVDSAGVETEVPMDDWVEVEVFAPAAQGDTPGKPQSTRDGDPRRFAPP
jgi:hypothetical protein